MILIGFNIFVGCALEAMGYGEDDNLKKLQLKLNGKELTAKDPSPGLYLLSFSVDQGKIIQNTWWRHQMETVSALLALRLRNSRVTDEFPWQRSVTRSVVVFFDLHLNKRLSQQSWGWWFETPPCSLWLRDIAIQITQLEKYCLRVKFLCETWVVVY